MNDVAQTRTTYSSHHYLNNVGAKGEYIVARLRKRKTIVLGKTNIPELGFWATSSNLLRGTICNPHAGACRQWPAGHYSVFAGH